MDDYYEEVNYLSDLPRRKPDWLRSARPEHIGKAQNEPSPAAVQPRWRTARGTARVMWR